MRQRAVDSNFPLFPKFPLSKNANAHHAITSVTALKLLDTCHHASITEAPHGTGLLSCFGDHSSLPVALSAATAIGRLDDVNEQRRQRGEIQRSIIMRTRERVEAIAFFSTSHSKGALQYRVAAFPLFVSLKIDL